MNEDARCLDMSDHDKMETKVHFLRFCKCSTEMLKANLSWYIHLLANFLFCLCLIYDFPLCIDKYAREMKSAITKRNLKFHVSVCPSM